MHNYRKLPVVIQAIQYAGNKDGKAVFRGSAPGDLPEWLTSAQLEASPIPPEGKWCMEADHIVIGTKEGMHIASEGDYVIRGIAGELYPCKPDIFAATYQMVANGAELRELFKLDEFDPVLGSRITTHDGDWLKIGNEDLWCFISSLTPEDQA